MPLNVSTESRYDPIDQTQSTQHLAEVKKTKLPDWSHTQPGLYIPLNSNKVTQHEADQALTNVMDKMGLGNNLSINDLEKADMGSMILMANMLSMKLFTTLANAAIKVSKIMTEAQNALNDKKVQEYQQQIDKAIEQADKARKGGIFGVIFDWIKSAVETIYGAFKIVEGVVTGNALDVAAGASYVVAGVAGMVKAAAETAGLLGADKNKIAEVVKWAGYVQMGAEFIATALDVVGGAIKSAGKEAAEKAAQETSEIAAKKGASEGAKQAAKEAEAEVAKYSTKEAARAAAAGTANTITNTLTDGLNKIAQGVIAKEKAQLEKEIEQLILQQSFKQTMIDWYQDSKKREAENAKEQMKRSTDLLESSSNIISKNGMIQGRIAASMA